MGGFARFFCINKTILKSEPDFEIFEKKDCILKSADVLSLHRYVVFNTTCDYFKYQCI